MNCFSYDIFVYHFWFTLWFSLGYSSTPEWLELVR